MFGRKIGSLVFVVLKAKAQHRISQCALSERAERLGKDFTFFFILHGCVALSVTFIHNVAFLRI